MKDEAIRVIKKLLETGILQFKPNIFLRDEISGRVHCPVFLVVKDVDEWTGDPKHAAAVALAELLEKQIEEQLRDENWDASQAVGRNDCHRKDRGRER